MVGRRSFLKASAALLATVPGFHWLRKVAAQQAPQLLLPPTTHHVTEDTAYLNYWLAPGFSNAELHLSHDGQTVQRLALDEARATLTLDNLNPATVYDYEITVNGETPMYQESNWYRGRFRTQPFEWPLRFVAIGDSGFGDNITAQLAEHIAAQNVDFFMHLGDIVYRANQYANDLVRNFALKFFLPFEQTLNRVPHYPTIGNHDRDFPTRLDGQSFYHWAFPPFDPSQAFDGQRLWYSFVINDVRFISLNTQVFFTDPGRQEQNQWLREQLADDSFRKTIIFFHVPFRASTRVHPTDGLAPDGDWRALFEEHRDQIGLVLSGHAHIYERILVNDVRYLISGGGSASIYEESSVAVPGSQVQHSLAHYTLVEIHEDRMQVEAFDINNTLLDRASWPL
jgi:hypothetical protein